MQASVETAVKPALGRWRDDGASSSAGVYRQRGQSLVETLIALIVLAPMAAGVTLLGQYLHIQQQTRAAAREAAWTATIMPRAQGKGLPARTAVEARLRAHQFGDLAETLRGDAKVPKEFADPMLLAFTGSALVKPENLRLTVYSDETPEKDFVARLAPSGVQPNDKGLVTAEVSVLTEMILGRDGQASALLDPLDKTPLTFKAKTVLLADSWDAGGAGEKVDGREVSAASRRTVRKRTAALSPAANFGGELDSVFGVVFDFLGVLEKIPPLGTLFVAGFGDIRLGRTAPDVVPADRLVEYRDVR